MNWIKSTHIDQNKRLRIEEVERLLPNIDLEIITKFAIESELTAQGQSGILNKDYQVEEMLKER